MNYYILVDGLPVIVDDVNVWSEWFEQSFDERVVKHTRLGDKESVLVSTVFLGTDMSWPAQPCLNSVGIDKPVLWETMIFGCNGLEDYQERYTSVEDALLGHEEALHIVKDLLKVK